MTNKPLDLNKPVQTKCGLPARIICTDAKGDYPLVVLIECLDGVEATMRYTPNGQSAGGGYSLVNVPEKVTKWVNVYYGSECIMHNSENQANEAARHNRIACIKIEYTEGEGL